MTMVVRLIKLLLFYKITFQHRKKLNPSKIALVFFLFEPVDEYSIKYPIEYPIMCSYSNEDSIIIKLVNIIAWWKAAL